LVHGGGGRAFDVSLWVIASILKIAVLVSLVWVLVLVHRELYGNKPLAKKVFAIWTLIPSAVVIALAATRPWWAARLGNDAIKFYHAGSVQFLGSELLEHRARCLRALSNGTVLVSELGLIIVVATIHVGLAFRLGNRAKYSVPLGLVAAEGILLAYAKWSPWFRFDYDVFHGDIISAPLLLDQIAIIANDPYTTLTAPMYLALIGSNLLILRIARSH